jgi:hypothetical protein
MKNEDERFYPFFYKCKNLNNDKNDDSYGSTDNSSMNLFNKAILNDKVFQQLQGLLNYPNIDVNNLLNVSKCFEVMKKSWFYWKLNKAYSAEYFHSPAFRSTLE